MSVGCPIDRRALLASGGAALATGTLAPTVGAAAEVTLPSPQYKGLVFTRGPAGRCDDKSLGMCVPHWSKASGRWLMWYYGRDQNFSSDAPETLTTGRIAMATSRNGIHWDRHAGPGFGGAILEPSTDPRDFDSFHIGLINVSYVKDRYWMWYFGGDRTPCTEPNGHQSLGYHMRPGLAQSKDGITWSKVRGKGPGGALFDYDDGDVYASWSSTVHDGEKFIMYYTAITPQYVDYHTRYAHSVDGVTWKKQGEIAWSDARPEWDKQGIVMRQVQANPFPGGPKWLMVYAAVDGNTSRFKHRSVAAAVSDDGITWRHMSDEPLLRTTDDGNWDHGGVSCPHLVRAGNEVRLYYYGYPPVAQAAAYPAGLGLAISTTGDMRNFKRIGT